MNTLLCVHVPVFRLAVARREHPEVPADEPAILADKRDRGYLVECDAQAQALGARVGQTILQARAAVGGALLVLVHDAAHARVVWHDMLDALDALSPLVDDSGEGTAYLDMRGIGGEPMEWIARALRALEPFDLPVRAALGPNKFLARALTFAPDGNVDALPLDVLGIDPRTLERLRLLGVERLEELAQLPHGPFVRRFGKDAATWHDRARGIDTTPFRPRPHELQIDTAIYGEGSAEQEEHVYFALRILAEQVCDDLERAGKAATLAQMTFECENGDVHAIDVGFAQATADARTMLDVMRAKLEGTTFGSPISGLRLQAMHLEECGAVITLFGQHGADPQALAVALARLQAATHTVPHRARVRPAHRLEERFSYDPFTVAQIDASAPGDRGIKTPVPQLRLLAVREVGVRMRGNVPASVESKKVVDCAGPWRVDDGWFEEGILRDEYDVLLDDGMLCRIYRHGERWFLRGAYD